MEDNNQYVTGMAIVGVSDVLEIPYMKTWNLIRSGTLKAVRVGGVWLVDPDSVRAYKTYLDTIRKAKQQLSL